MKFVPVVVAILGAAALAAGPSAWAAPAHAKTAKTATPAHVSLPTNVRPERYSIVIKPNAEKLTFSGHEDVTLTVTSATDRIVLNAADIAFQKAGLSGESAAPKVLLDKDQQTAAFVFDHPI